MTFGDWGKNWKIETTGMEDLLLSPYLEEPFSRSREEGVIPEFIDGYGLLVLPTTGRYFQIPYGLTVHQKVENLVVAGRCVAGDKISHAATRNMMCCIVTGQATGVAAAVSVKDGVTCGAVDVRRVQRALVKQGARVF